MGTKLRWVFFISVLVMMLGCGSATEDGGTGGNSPVKLSLLIQNPDPNASGAAKALSSEDVAAGKSLPSSSSVTSLTITATAGSTTTTKTASVSSGASSVSASMDLAARSGYTITVQGTDSNSTTNGVSTGFYGSGTFDLTSATTATLNAAFLNLASVTSGDARYCRVSQDTSLQTQILCGWNSALSPAQKSTATCNVEIGTQSSPSVIDTSQANGRASAPGASYIIMGPGLITPSCFLNNSSGTKTLRLNGSWTTDSAGNTVLKCTMGATQTTTNFASSRTANFAADCSLNGATSWVAIPKSGMARMDTTGGSNTDSSLIANGSSCSTSRNGETCSSGFCVSSGLCIPLTAPSMALVVTNASATGIGSGDGICISKDGNTLYVVRTSAHCIQSFDVSSDPTNASLSNFVGTCTSLGSSDGTGTGARFASPRNCAVDNNGNMYIADVSNNAIRKVVISSQVVTTLTSSLGSGLWGIATDDSNIYVSDFSANTIQKYVIGTGTLSTLVSSGLSSPRQIALDSTGSNLYIADFSNNAVKKLALSSNTLSTVASSSSTLASPLGLAIDPTDTYLLVGLGPAGSTGHQIQQVTLSSGSISSFVCSGAQGSANGTGTSATCDSPANMAINPQATRVYWFDTGNTRIRKFTGQSF